MASSPPAPKLKLKFGAPKAATAEKSKTTKSKASTKTKTDADVTPKSSTKINPKKRPRKDAEEDDGGSSKKIPRTGSGLSIKIGAALLADEGKHSPKLMRTPTIKIPAIVNKRQTIRLKSKATPGVVPKRDPGNGYDSEAEDVESDPHIEHHFVIRMLPGEDCDCLRKAVTERRVGTKDGPNISLHFFDKEARRGLLSIKGNLYAAFLVDLPCIVESHKSWDRKNFYKVSDLHQMLLITKRVSSLDEARHAEPPDLIDSSNWQYPHGITPPMHHARTRRFRKRVSKRTIEAVEEEVDRLLRLDEEADDTFHEIIDPRALEPGDEDDAEGELDIDMIEDSIEVDELPDAASQPEDEEEGEDEFAQMLADGLVGMMSGGEENVAPGVNGDMQAGLNGTLPPTIETPDAQSTLTTAAPGSTFDDSADDDSDQVDDEIDEDERAAQQERAQLREEVADIRKEIEHVDAQISGQTNKILQVRLKDKRTKLKRDLQLKLANLGQSAEEDEA